MIREYGLPETLLQEMNTIFRQFPAIDKVILYGSRAMDTHHEGSDIDLAICGHMLKFNDLLSVSNRLEELGYPYRFDVQRYHYINSAELKEHIDRVGVVIHSKAES